jgi:hypothetical protein
MINSAQLTGIKTMKVKLFFTFVLSLAALPALALQDNVGRQWNDEHRGGHGAPAPVAGAGAVGYLIVGGYLYRRWRKNRSI